MTKYQPVFFDIETTGLNPMAQSWWNNTDHAAQVVCCAFGTISGWDGDKDMAEFEVEVVSGNSEYTLLQELSDTLQQKIAEVEYLEDDGSLPEGHAPDKEAFLVGYNSRSFDHPYLGARYARLRQDPGAFSYGKKRLDLMRVVKRDYGFNKSQDDVMGDLGIEHEDSITGKDVPDLFADGKMGPIRQHARADVKDLMAIFMEYREMAMETFYDHYGIDADATFVETVDLD